jgi:catechol 2,3-dioxygenase-like lactoylglutathione lyase family enzyme
MPRARRLLETCLYVDDLERAGEFYERNFELELIHADARMRAYAVGDTVLLLFSRGQSLKAVETPGGTIPPHDGSGPLHVAFAMSVYFRDPDGHLLEVATPGLWPNY